MIKNILSDKLGNPESPPKKRFSTNMSILGEDLLRASYRLFYLQFRDSSDQ